MDRGARAYTREELAQGTLEYAVVLLVFLAILAGLAALAHAAADGTLSRLVEEALSHGVDAGGLLDLALY